MISLLNALTKNIKLSILMFVFIFLWYGFQFYDFDLHTTNFMEHYPILTILFVLIILISSLLILPKCTPKEITEVFFIEFFTLFCIVFILGNLLILPNTLEDRHSRVGIDFNVFISNIKRAFSISSTTSTDVVRWDFGFNYPTVGALAYVASLLSFVYVYYNKLSRKHFIILGIVTTIFYSISLVRALILIIPFIFCFAFIDKIKILFEKYGKVLYFIIPFGIIISFLITIVLHDNELLNTLSSRRISIWYKYIQNIPIEFINFNPPIDSLKGDSLDNGFLFPIFVVGAFPSIIIFIGYTLIIKYLLKSNDYVMLYIFIIWSVYAFMEPVYFYNYNFMLYFIPYVFMIEFKELKYKRLNTNKK